MTDFEFLKGRFQMFFGFILAAVWSGLEIAAAINHHIEAPTTLFTSFVWSMNAIFIGANSTGTAKTFQYLKDYLNARQSANSVLAGRRLEYRIEKEKAKQGNTAIVKAILGHITKKPE